MTGTRTPEFLRAVLPDNIHPDERIEIRAISPTGEVRRFWADSPHAAIELAHPCLTTHNLYFGVGLRLGQTGGAANVTRVACVWADVDGKCFAEGKPEALAAIKALAIQAHIVVDSGNGYHAYWLLQQPIDAVLDGAHASAVMRTICTALSQSAVSRLDPVHDISRVLRLPNSLNLKDTLPKRTPVVTFNTASPRWSLDDFERLGRVEVKPVADEQSTDTPSSWEGDAEAALSNARKHGLPRWAEDALNRPSEHGRQSRSELDFAVVRELMSYGASPQDAELIWLASSLGQREKVQTRANYRSSTIERARESINSASAARLRNDPLNDGEWSPPVAFHSIDLPHFPIDSLPTPLRDFVVAESLATQTPLDLAAMMCLGIVAAAVAAKVVVEPLRGWREGSNLYIAVALESGERKSAVHRDTIAPIHAWERERERRMAQDIAKYRATKALIEARLVAMTRKAANAKSPGTRNAAEADVMRLTEELAVLVPVVAPRRCTDDCTPEKLAVLMSVHGSQMAIVSSEGGVFNMIAGLYSKGVSNLDVYLKGHAGDNIFVDRIGREPLHVSSPALTMVLALQPSVITRLGDQPEFRDRGLNARFIFIVPSGRVGYRDVNPPSVSDKVRGAYAECITQLLDIEPPLDATLVPQPHVIRLSDDALSLFSQFRLQVEAQLRDDGDLAALLDWGSKLPGAVVRIAALLHMADRSTAPEPWRKPVPATILARAIEIGEYLIPHAKAAFSLMGADPAVQAAQRLLRWIEREQRVTFSKRDMFEGCKGRFKKVTDLDAPLSMLVAHGYIREHVVEHRSPGRPSHLFDVSPYIASQYSQNLRVAGSSANSANFESESQHENDSMPDPRSEVPCCDECGRTIWDNTEPCSHASITGHLTAEAAELLAKVHSGGLPTFATKSLRSIARANGMTDVDDRSADEILAYIEALAAAEEDAR